MRLHKLTPEAIEKIDQGERLLRAEDFINQEAAAGQSDGAILQLIDDDKNFVAKAIVGHQNKGIAWVFTDHERIYFNQDFIENVIEDAIENRQAFFENTETTAFRLFNGEGDGLGGVTMDWYDGFIQINWYTRAVFAERETFIKVLLYFLPQIKGIYETKRFKIQEDEQPIEHTYGEAAPQPIEILENGIRYAIYLGAEWMTGLFLDQREVRQFIKSQVSGATLLNLFSYTGGFSVAAAVGGANSTISVDVANRSLEKTTEQFALNQIEAPTDQHEIRVMDVFDYIQFAKRHQKTFDWIVCDPPSFARTKDYLFRAETDYQQLAADLFEITAPGGFCVLSTNHSGYPKELFMVDMNQVAQSAVGEYYLIQAFGLPEDYPTSADEASQYLKVLVYYRAQ